MEPMGRVEFSKLEAMKKVRKNITGAGIVCYVSAVLTLIMGMIGGNILVIVDVISLIVLGLFIHLKLSYPASIILLVFSVVNVVLSFLSGAPGGWLLIVAGVYSIIACRKLDKAYKEYLATGMLPVQEGTVRPVQQMNAATPDEVA